MELRADALRFVLAQGLPAVIEVSGRSMEPTIQLGAKVDVAGLAEADALAPGEVVLVATGGDGLVLHRVMAAFEEGGERLVVHQGDAAASTFAIAARRDVLARVRALAHGAGPAPTPDHLAPRAHALYRRRRLVVEGFLAARRLARALGLSDAAVVRRCGQIYRRVARAIWG
jgi:hypothetical protein